MLREVTSGSGYPPSSSRGNVGRAMRPNSDNRRRCCCLSAAVAAPNRAEGTEPGPGPPRGLLAPLPVGEFEVPATLRTARLWVLPPPGSWKRLLPTRPGNACCGDGGGDGGGTGASIPAPPLLFSASSCSLRRRWAMPHQQTSPARSATRSRPPPPPAAMAMIVP